ncbi:uncharacterized protein HD556DRAFT_1387937 [Suillus plorans]|uniref:Uncharacterized protein n=1 Tax=Suillus plorans TaxID=116603 RepID=A0A9P7AJU9_9AGAM|nr:uncharacterized protein HD556DRAFT_1420069 [Suillus plorans]XP_041157320.1 uncharacterized protein HD556DRAFT_1392846 [Suillus plorans]XP_041157844.1 uncharacterized protein HD556DRAFT_1387937 [Suillus plorans]KAG1785821.1 hypothetical protein HD556DRAFT_1420069 [Suillus plorans]KAG1790348.1 hypothetical protein HD556DRAFT_1392846 [Suillus plorans]KAG1790916.1 hypothetical protein HD556DRAFT_1387937 [Suillus plorans]
MRCVCSPFLSPLLFPSSSRPLFIFSILVSSASVRATPALAGVCWVFAHGAGGIGCAKREDAEGSERALNLST